MSDGLGMDAPLPPAMATRAVEVGVAKATMPLVRMGVLAVLAGAFISFGAMFSTVVTSGTGMGVGTGRLLGGLVFSLGLVLVVVGGAELFTGNTLVVMAFASRRVRLSQLLRGWVVVYVGNFAGALATALAVYWSDQYRQSDGAIGRRVLAIAETKSSLDFRQALVLGVLANALVCLGVWLSLAARTVTDKVFAVVLPVSAFVAAGFEHSIANMYFLPAGIFVKDGAPDGFWAGIEARPGDFPSIGWKEFLVDNLVPVTIGNVIGGAVLVGLVYWLAYLREEAAA